jgi:hypothetical protein
MTIQSAMEIALIKAHIVRMQYEYADLPEEEQKEAISDYVLDRFGIDNLDEFLELN